MPFDDSLPSIGLLLNHHLHITLASIIFLLALIKIIKAVLLGMKDTRKISTNMSPKFIQMIHLLIRISASLSCKYNSNWVTAGRMFGQHSPTGPDRLHSGPWGRGNGIVLIIIRANAKSPGRTYSHPSCVPEKEREVVSKGSWWYYYQERVEIDVPHNQQ